MTTRSLTARAQELLPRAFHACAAGLGRHFVGGGRMTHPASPGHDVPAEGRHDFDFLHGRWRVRNVRLKERLAGCTEWETFEAVQHCGPVLGGIGNVDEFITDWAGGYRGMTLRLYDPRQRQWSLYWANNQQGVLEPSVTGRFREGVGTFHGRDRHKGRDVWVRFRWYDIRPDGAHWEQAFSPDRGENWETNWHMYLTREAA